MFITSMLFIAWISLMLVLCAVMGKNDNHYRW